MRLTATLYPAGMTIPEGRDAGCIVKRCRVTVGCRLDLDGKGVVRGNGEREW